MGGMEVGLISVLALLAAVILGMHIGIALGLVSFAGIVLLKDGGLAARMVAATATDALQDHAFGVVPLFVLMGMVVSICGLGRDTFDVFERIFRRVRGGLGVATVGANAAFAAVTGVSIASAAVFTKIAVPEMVRHGYQPRFAVGVVAGSSLLGMLIPPSLLMIIYGVLAQESVGRMFLAGIVPGLLLAVVFSLMILGMARWWPRKLYATAGGQAPAALVNDGVLALLRKGVPIVALIVVVLGGIYGGLFTATEAGAVGAAGALVIAALRRQLSAGRVWQVLVETGHVTVSILFLVLAAALYARMLALSGLPAALADLVVGAQLGWWGFIALYVALLLLLGCILDSVSILLILVPIVLPIATTMGMDLIWFGIVTIVAVEIGLLTPPFGISVYTVKSSLDDRGISTRDIFAGAMPFVLAMLVLLAVLVAFPALSTTLARL
ncbi:TRAP transporter large permease subunit [Ramlibacter sp. AW1]|uniref:TRAP transporter large permease protein n=1 Tax=Ramlibacter aurantiacus TaxID=2801330 RepID=A0A937D9C3_9BURK|nr:TRAP transporter large permease subunit [Ramlibacter aurantiacus]MBL0423006.1 TRAP transporter large permease subunit [Ramlibacter aurantiacus]